MKSSENEDQLGKEEDTNSNNFLKMNDKLNIKEKKDCQKGEEIIDIDLPKTEGNFESKTEDNSEKIKEFLKNANLNSLNIKYNENFLMNICETVEPILIDKLIKGIYIQNNKKTMEKELFEVDNNNKNILHYLFNNNVFEYDVIKIFGNLMDYAKNLHQNKNTKEFFTKEDRNGITPLVIILKKGWFNILKKYFEYFEYKPHIIKSNKNNNLHCAIDGKNIKCLQLLLNHCTIEELNQTNSEGLTP